MHKHRKIAYLLTISAVVALSGTLNIAHAESPSFDIRTRPITEIVAYFAGVYGVDTKLALSVMECESHGIQDTKGDEGHAHGIYQFWQGTWNDMSKEYGENLDINSPYDQSKLALWALAHDKGDNWTTYTAIRKGGIYSFYSRSLKKSFTVKCNLIS